MRKGERVSRSAHHHHHNHPCNGSPYCYYGYDITIMSHSGWLVPFSPGPDGSLCMLEGGNHRIPIDGQFVFCSELAYAQSIRDSTRPNQPVCPNPKEPPRENPGLRDGKKSQQQLASATTTDPVPVRPGAEDPDAQSGNMEAARTKGSGDGARFFIAAPRMTPYRTQSSSIMSSSVCTPRFPH